MSGSTFLTGLLSFIKAEAGVLAPEVLALVQPQIAALDAKIAASGESPDFKELETLAVGLVSQMLQFEAQKLAGKI